MSEARDWAEALRAFKTAILTTRGADGRLRARPMAMRQAVRREEIWFATSIASKKCEDLAHDPRCALVLYDAAEGTTIAISGRGEVIRDRKLARELWDVSWLRWFPEGPAQRDVALLRVIPDLVERHDAETGEVVVLHPAARAGGRPRRAPARRAPAPRRRASRA